MDALIPVVEYQTSTRNQVESPFTETDTTVNEFLSKVKQEKTSREEANARLKPYMEENMDLIMKYVHRHHPDTTFNNVLEIAFGWDIDDIKTLIHRATKNKTSQFVRCLMAY